MEKKVRCKGAGIYTEQKLKTSLRSGWGSDRIRWDLYKAIA